MSHYSDPRAMFGVFEYIVVLSFGSHLSGLGISGLAAMDFLHRSVHLCRSRAQGAAPEKYRIPGHLFGYSYLVGIFRWAGRPVRCFLQEADLGCEREKRSWDYSTPAPKNPNRRPCATSSAEWRWFSCSARACGISF